VSRHIDRFREWPGMYSQAGQDAFVIEITQEKRQGKFLEFGAGHPMEGSNTFLLERSFNWSGTCIDDGQTWQNLPALWKEHRPQSKFFLQNVFDFDMSELENHYDYLQIDIDSPENCFKILEKVISKSRFSTITFEHDIWRNTAEARDSRDNSRKLLLSYGYELFANDVTIQDSNGNFLFFEDWYVDPKTISKTQIDKYKCITETPTTKFWQQIMKC